MGRGLTAGAAEQDAGETEVGGGTGGTETGVDWTVAGLDGREEEAPLSPSAISPSSRTTDGTGTDGTGADTADDTEVDGTVVVDID